MRIQHNIAAMNSYRNFTVNNSKLSKNLEKLSSGYRVNRAGDDAAGLAVSEKMRRQITGMEAAQKNANDGIGLIQTAEGALSEVHDILNRMYYLAEQAANGTYTNATDRSNLNLEVSQLKEEITRIGNSAKFSSKDVMTTGTIKLAIDLYGGDLTMNTKSMTELTTGLSGVSISDTNSAESARGTIETVINSVSSYRAQLGAYQNRLEHSVKQLGVMRENLTNAESQIRDTDIAEEMTAFTKNSIMSQAAQAMVAQANQVPQGVLQLLQ